MPRGQQAILQLSSRDNTAICLEDVPAGTRLPQSDIETLVPIQAGHKVALTRIDPGQNVLKYGQIIGTASMGIQVGEHVHTHNIAVENVGREYKIGIDAAVTDHIPKAQQASFDGFRRPNGRCGTRNFLGILPTVACASSIARFIADEMTAKGLKDYPHVDGVVALAHGTGCCMTPGSEGFAILQRTLAGYAQHPNFGGILMVGLGCETNSVDCLQHNLSLAPQPRLQMLNIQDSGGTSASIQQGVDALQAMLPAVNDVRREALSAQHIILGLECGGSDAYSGITANPALGAAVDLLIRHGGTAILSETPEIYGAEHLLLRRSVTPRVGDKLIEKIKWWEDYTARHGSQMDNNPSPGNKAGGLTTIYEKSLGAVSKGGTTNLNAVYNYADPVEARGLVFMDTPGYDLVSITGMIAGGANVICFTTGRGTVCGFKPVPTIKLASNTPLYQRMPDDIDIDCGGILETGGSIQTMGEAIFNRIVDVASGKLTQSERFGYGDLEFVPWPMGAVM